MRKYFETVSNSSTGLPVFRAKVSVLNANGTEAQLYSDNGITAISQPVRTDVLGFFSFFISDGTYTIILSDPDGGNTRTISNVEIYEDGVARLTLDQVNQAADFRISANVLTPFSSSTGASLSSYSRADTGSVTKDLLSYLKAQPRNPREYGFTTDWAVGNVDDNSIYLQRMLDAAYADKSGPTNLNGGVIYVNSPITVPKGCGIDGGVPFGEPLGSSYSAKRGVIVCGPNAQFNWDQSSTGKDFVQVRDIAAIPPTSDAAALASLANWSGIANNFIAPDVQLQRMTCVGFGTAVKSAGVERPTIEHLRSDCINGIDASQCYDTGRIHDAQIWPFWNAHVTGMSPSALFRNGKGMHIHDTADGFLTSDSLVYGYLVNLHAENVYGAQFVNFWMDNLITIAATKQTTGVLTDGTMRSCKFIIGHVDSCYVNYDWQHSPNSDGTQGHGVIGSALSCGQSIRASMRFGTGSSGMLLGISNTGAQSTAIGEFEVMTSVGPWQVIGVDVTDSAAQNLVAIQNADKRNWKVSHVQVKNGPAYIDRLFFPFVEVYREASSQMIAAGTPTMFTPEGNRWDSYGEFLSDTYQAATEGVHTVEAHWAMTPADATSGEMRARFTILSNGVPRSYTVDALTQASTAPWIDGGSLTVFMNVGDQLSLNFVMDRGGSVNDVQLRVIGPRS